MPRRRSESGNTGDPEEGSTSAPSDDVQIRAVVTGGADAVKKQLAIQTERTESKPEPAVDDFEKFFNLLRNPKFIVKVKRLRPKQWKGVKTAVEVWTSELPLQWEEIKSEVQENAGGGTYKVSVIDPEKGGIIDARNFELDGEPTIQSAEMTPEEKAMFGPQEKDATQVSIDGLDRRAAVTAKLLEVENLEHQLEEARLARTGKGKKGSDESDSRIIDLDRRLTEAKHQAELEARDRKHAEDMRELKALIAQNQTPPKKENSELTILLQQMRDDRQASDNRFNALLTQIKDDKLNAVLDEVKQIKNRPQRENGGMLEMAETMLKLRKVFGWGGDGEDDEDEDDPNDDRPWWQKALDRLGDKLTPKVIDKIFERLDGLETSGKTVNKDDFTKSLEIEMKKAEDEAVRIATERAIKALPQPKENPLPKKEPVPQVNVMERKVVGAEASPAPAPAPETKIEPETAEKKPDLHLVTDPPAIAPPASVPGQPQMSVAQETCLRVCNVLLILERELETRPRQFNWNYEGVWNMLPEAVLEKVCQAKTPAEVFDAFRVEGINVADLDKMKEKVLSAPRAAAWMSMGIRELNRWWTKVEKDPEFDPADEGEDDEAGEEGGSL